MAKLIISNQVFLVNYKNLEESILIKATKEFFNFPDRLHGFNLVTENEYYVEIEFYNYQKTHCSILYHKELNEIIFKKGIGSVNCDRLKLINNLIELNWFEFSNE